MSQVCVYKPEPDLTRRLPRTRVGFVRRGASPQPRIVKSRGRSFKNSSWSGPGLVQVWFWLVQVWFRFGSGLVQVWFRFGSGLVQVGSGLVQVWFRSGSGLVQVWFRFGSGLVQVWVQVDFMLASISGFSG